MRNSLKIGLSFGLTSGIITTLGLMVGLAATTHSKLIVLGGILTIAIADSMSDALGIHISQESTKISQKSVWESTISTFLSKLVFALSFALPVIYLDMNTAVLASIVWSIVLLAILSYAIAKKQKENPLHVITEHITIAAVVVILTNFIGSWIGTNFV